VSGLLLAYTLPPRFPVGLAALGGFGAVAIRGLFGGLGKNWLNPALTSRLLLGCLFPQAMLHFIAPRFGTVSGIEAVTGATPLAVFHSAKLVLAGSAAQSADIVTQSAQTVYRLYASTGDCMLGLRAGAIGETSAVCLLAGAFFLFYRRIVGIRVPFIILATTALLVWVFGGIESLFSGDPLFHLFNGGLLLGALFMATDPVTSPGKPIGKIVFGLGCGALTYFFRSWMGTEGVGYAILIMNLTKPVFDL
jgi:electron transport complex protein RnfD